MAIANNRNVQTLSYRVILEPDEDDGGRALRNAREVIELELGYLGEKGLPIPPNDAENIRIERVTVVAPAA